MYGYNVNGLALQYCYTWMFMHDKPKRLVCDSGLCESWNLLHARIKRMTSLFIKSQNVKAWAITLNLYITLAQVTSFTSMQKLYTSHSHAVNISLSLYILNRTWITVPPWFQRENAASLPVECHDSEHMASGGKPSGCSLWSGIPIHIECNLLKQKCHDPEPIVIQLSWRRKNTNQQFDKFIHVHSFINTIKI